MTAFGGAASPSAASLANPRRGGDGEDSGDQGSLLPGRFPSSGSSHGRQRLRLSGAAASAAGFSRAAEATNGAASSSIPSFSRRSPPYGDTPGSSSVDRAVSAAPPPHAFDEDGFAFSSSLPLTGVNGLRQPEEDEDLLFDADAVNDFETRAFFPSENFGAADPRASSLTRSSSGTAALLQRWWKSSKALTPAARNFSAVSQAAAASDSRGRSTGEEKRGEMRRRESQVPLQVCSDQSRIGTESVSTGEGKVSDVARPTHALGRRVDTVSSSSPSPYAASGGQVVRLAASSAAASAHEMHSVELRPSAASVLSAAYPPGAPAVLGRPSSRQESSQDRSDEEDSSEGEAETQFDDYADAPTAAPQSSSGGAGSWLWQRLGFARSTSSSSPSAAGSSSAQGRVAGASALGQRALRVRPRRPRRRYVPMTGDVPSGEQEEEESQETAVPTSFAPSAPSASSAAEPRVLGSPALMQPMQEEEVDATGGATPRAPPAAPSTSIGWRWRPGFLLSSSPQSSSALSSAAARRPEVDIEMGDLSATRGDAASESPTESTAQPTAEEAARANAPALSLSRRIRARRAAVFAALRSAFGRLRRGGLDGGAQGGEAGGDREGGRGGERTDAAEPQEDDEEDDPSCHQMLLVTGCLCWFPLLWVVGAMLWCVTPKEHRRARMWGAVNVCLVVLTFAYLFLHVWNVAKPTAQRAVLFNTEAQLGLEAPLSLRHPGSLWKVEDDGGGVEPATRLAWTFSEPSEDAWKFFSLSRASHGGDSDPIPYGRVIRSSSSPPFALLDAPSHQRGPSLLGSATDTWALGPESLPVPSGDRAPTVMLGPAVIVSGRVLFSVRFGAGDAPSRAALASLRRVFQREKKRAEADRAETHHSSRGKAHALGLPQDGARPKPERSVPGSEHAASLRKDHALDAVFPKQMTAEDLLLADQDLPASFFGAGLRCVPLRRYLNSAEGAGGFRATSLAENHRHSGSSDSESSLPFRWLLLHRAESGGEVRVASQAVDFGAAKFLCHPAVVATGEAREAPRDERGDGEAAEEERRENGQSHIFRRFIDVQQVLFRALP
ncbi:hypothetical protein BESB_014150 [Besnoitia besnoiti]|uniref:Transmembrane protein n=1 Tax=Besnoitia besnoiti TaxID=94643 RepID=A0A2A9MAU2_BESBE|nr:hypothetical protein BESB_014150 [Besnoitia besnoiti]PFH32803.1 hypothetical protein BESB_014150 [Besnoitia besnoiti]